MLESATEDFFPPDFLSNFIHSRSQLAELKATFRSINKHAVCLLKSLFIYTLNNLNGLDS